MVQNSHFLLFGLGWIDSSISFKSVQFSITWISCSRKSEQLFQPLFSKGGPWSPRSQAGRTVASYYLMICVVLVATYSANLIAALTVQKISLPFETLGGLAQDTQYTILLPASSVQATLFKVWFQWAYSESNAIGVCLPFKNGLYCFTYCCGFVNRFQRVHESGWRAVRPKVLKNMYSIILLSKLE